MVVTDVVARRAARAARGADLPRPGADLGDRGDRGRLRDRAGVLQPGLHRARAADGAGGRVPAGQRRQHDRVERRRARRAGDRHRARARARRGLGVHDRRARVRGLGGAAHARPPALARGARAAGRAARRAAGRLARGPLAPVGVGGARGDVARAAARARALPDARADRSPRTATAAPACSGRSPWRSASGRCSARSRRCDCGRAIRSASRWRGARCGRRCSCCSRSGRRWRCCCRCSCSMGFGLSMFDVSWDTTLAERIPPHALSRVSAFD